MSSELISGTRHSSPTAIGLPPDALNQGDFKCSACSFRLVSSCLQWFGLVSYSGDENGKEVGNLPEEPTENSMLKENLAVSSSERKLAMHAQWLFQDLRAENAKLKLKVDKLARIVTMRRMSENDSQTVNQDQLLALARNAMVGQACCG